MSRRAHQCHRTGCDSQATHAAHLRLWFDGLQQALPLDMLSTIRSCEAHIPAFTVWLLSVENRIRIAAGLLEQGFGEPDFSSAEVEFVPLADRRRAA